MNKTHKNAKGCRRLILLTVAGIFLMGLAHAKADYPIQWVKIAGSNGWNVNVTGYSNNDPINTWPTNGNRNERWSFDSTDTSYYVKIRHLTTGKLLAPLNQSLTSGNSCVLYDDLNNSNQTWKLVGVDQDGSGSYLNYKIVAFNDNTLALTLVSGSNRVILQTYSGTADQKFQLNSVGLGGFAGTSKDMSGNLKAATTGGLIGQIVTTNNLSDLQSKLSDTSTPMTIILTANISGTSKTVITLGSNKTLVGSYGTQTLNNIYFNTSASSRNIVLRNLIINHDSSINANNDIPLYISNNRNYWIDHCTYNGHSDLETNPSAHTNDVDKLVYVGAYADFVTISHCEFTNHKYGLILGWPGDATSDNVYDGYPRMTQSFNYYSDLHVRAPGLMRYGNFHCVNNYIYNYDLGYTIYTDSNIYSESNSFNKGALAGGTINDGGNGHFIDVGSYPTPTGQTSPLTTWKPNTNYGYKVMKAHVDDVHDVRGFCTTYSGAQTSSANFKYADWDDFSTYY